MPSILRRTGRFAATIEQEIEPVAGDANETVEFMVLSRGQIHFEGSGAELLASQDRYLKEFLVDTLPPW